MASWPSVGAKSNGDEKAKSIEEAQNHVKALEARVDELTATSSRLTSEITHTEDEVSSNEKALEASEALRAKQVTEFAADEKDLTQSATSVDNALGVIGTRPILVSADLQSTSGQCPDTAEDCPVKT